MCHHCKQASPLTFAYAAEVVYLEGASIERRTNNTACNTMARRHVSLHVDARQSQFDTLSFKSNLGRGYAFASTEGATKHRLF